jgi:hypothetical protein
LRGAIEGGSWVVGGGELTESEDPLLLYYDSKVRVGGGGNGRGGSREMQARRIPAIALDQLEQEEEEGRYESTS